MNDYLFAYHPYSRTFVARFRVGQSPEEGDLGRVSVDGVEAAIAALRKKYPPPEYVVECMSGTSWETVETNFWGLFRD